MKITFSNHLRLASFHLGGTGLMIVCLWFFRFEVEISLVFLGFWMIYTIPALFLHIEYSICNSNEKIEISNDGLTRRKRGKVRKFAFSDFTKIILYKSASLDKGGIQLMAIESYYYVRILTKFGEDIIITNLMNPRIDEEIYKLTGLPYERKKRFFCTLSWK